MSVKTVMRPEKLRQLMDAHAAALVLFARQFCASPEDVVQEAFVKLSSQQVMPDRILAWLYRVVRNGAISAGRSESRRRKHERRAALSQDWFQPDLETALDSRTVTQALQSLPLEQREVVIAHLWSGLPFAEIAKLIGASSSTAHRLYQAAIRNLRDRLEMSCPRT